MLAEIDDPPRSRTRGMIVGIVLALPFAVALGGWFLPMLVEAVLGGSQTHDDRVALETGYMDAVCTQAMALPRDEALCECVLATEYAGKDCQAPFMAWSVALQQQHCAEPDNKKASLSFCTCVETVAENMAAAPDEAGAQQAADNYRNCQTLADAVYLPTIEELGEELGEELSE